MTSFSVAGARPARVTLVGVLGFTAALAVASQVALPMPGTPVPFTLQPLVVVLAGLWLGPLAGAASMCLYLALGALGLPVFAPFGAPGVARFFGPTGGYLLAYPVTAFVAGWLAERAPSFGGRAVAAVAGTLVLLLGGLAQLAVLNGDIARALAIGVTPFVLLDFVKALIAAAIAPSRTARTRSPA
jgi:biotin transport system substrate-specific component